METSCGMLMSLPLTMDLQFEAPTSRQAVPTFHFWSGKSRRHCSGGEYCNVISSYGCSYLNEKILIRDCSREYICQTATANSNFIQSILTLQYIFWQLLACVIPAKRETVSVSSLTYSCRIYKEFLKPQASIGTK